MQPEKTLFSSQGKTVPISENKVVDAKVSLILLPAIFEDVRDNVTSKGVLGQRGKLDKNSRVIKWRIYISGGKG